MTMTNAVPDSDPVTSEAEVPGPEQIRAYNDEGYVLLPGLISPEAAETLRREVLGIMDVIGLGQTKLRQTHEYLAGSAIDRLVNSSRLREIAGRLMGGPATLYMPFTAVKSGGGGGQFHFHQDNQYTRFDGPGINLWFALVPMIQENGCLQVVPRSHLHGTLPAEGSPDQDGHKKVTFEPDDFVSVRMEPGDCVAFTRLTVHGSGANTTPEPRVAYAVQFHRDDVNFSLDGGVTWTHLKTTPRWATGPVERITPPQQETRDGH
jgi:2-oxoglutarate-dependent dioxygenase